MKDNIIHSKGLFAFIEENSNNITYPGESKIDIEEVFEELMSQEPKEPILLVSRLSHKFITAHNTNDKDLLKEAQAELKEQVHKENVRLSKITGMSIESIKKLSEKYHKDIYDRWHICTVFVGDDDNEYDDRYEDTYLKFENGEWRLVVIWTDGYEYKTLTNHVIKEENLIRKFLSPESKAKL